jgi:hypothetical protein
MSAIRAQDGTAGLERKPFSFSRRLEEIGMFFQKRSPQHQTMRRTARRLEKARVAYAILGGMALNAHRRHDGRC